MTKNTRTILAATFAADGTITQEQAAAALKVLAGKGNAVGAVVDTHLSRRHTVEFHHVYLTAGGPAAAFAQSPDCRPSSASDRDACPHLQASEKKTEMSHRPHAGAGVLCIFAALLPRALTTALLT